jgi:DNA-binding MarR family transcriptional regulator
MENRYYILKQIIDLWETYEKEEEHLNLADFAEWMRIQLQKRRYLNKKISYHNNSIEQPVSLSYFKSMDEPTRFLESISRISRFHEIYMRKFLVDLPINNRLEYLFLKTISQMQRFKKTDLINLHLVDYTTGMDTIKRLIRNGFLTETSDGKDKRVKLLELSKSGLNVLQEADRQIGEEKNMFLTCISANKWKKALPVLDEIDKLHHSVYLKYNDRSSAELVNLMDSLKHLYR